MICLVLESVMLALFTYDMLNHAFLAALKNNRLVESSRGDMRYLTGVFLFQ